MCSSPRIVYANSLLPFTSVEVHTLITCCDLILDRPSQIVNKASNVGNSVPAHRLVKVIVEVKTSTVATLAQYIKVSSKTSASETLVVGDRQRARYLWHSSGGVYRHSHKNSLERYYSCLKMIGWSSRARNYTISAQLAFVGTHGSFVICNSYMYNRITNRVNM